MNIEHLCRAIKNNYHRLRDEKKALLFLRYQFELLAWKQQKLKLGAIVFEIKEIAFAGITLVENAEIRYIRQDTTKDDELKIENRLKALGWKWDFKNVMALLVVVILALVLAYAYAYVWYCENLPTLAYRDPSADEMIYRSLESTLAFRPIGLFKALLILNFWVVNTLTTFCVNYGMLF